MKKNIIIAAIAAASALLLSVSCQKENQPASQDEVNAGAKTFTATIEQSLTKTTITADYKVNWTSTDKISINGKSYTASPKTDAAKADFTADDGEATLDGNNKFKAIYPSTLYATDHFALPASQTYTADQFNAPMYAESTTQSLTFKNICAVLAIKVTSEDIATLKSIKVKSDKKLNGTFTVASTTAGFKATIGTDGTNEVVLSSDAAISPASEGTTFYVAIPEQEYSYLKIYLSEDGTLYKRAMITKKATGLGTIACNKIYNINYETNAVQIYANGPYWSTMNIGATSATEAGKYFMWGYTEGHKVNTTGTTTSGTTITDAFKDQSFKEGTRGDDANGFAWDNYIKFTSDTYSSSSRKVFTKYVSQSKASTYGNDGTFYDDKTVLDLADDAANANWGGSWRMPTNEDFIALAANGVWYWTTDYNSTGVSGYIVYVAKNDSDKGKAYMNTYMGSIWTKWDGFQFSAIDASAATETYGLTDPHIFLPVAGFGDGPDLIDAHVGEYWSSSFNPDNPREVFYFFFHSEGAATDAHKRYCGQSVRALSE